MLPAPQNQDRITLTGSGSPSSLCDTQAPVRSPLREQRTCPDKTHSSEAPPAQAAGECQSTRASQSSNSISPRASSTMSALQGCNMQIQASMLPSISTTDTVHSNSAAPAGLATCNMLSRPSRTVSRLQRRMLGHPDRTSKTELTSLHKLTRGGTSSVQSRVNSAGVKEAINSAHEDQDDGSMFMLERLVANAATEVIHANQQGHVSSHTPDGVVDLNDEDVPMNEAPYSKLPLPIP
jgi:hypothetical protein